MRKLLSDPYDPTETRQVWTREFGIRNAHNYDLYRICIGIGSETAGNGQYKRLTEKMRVMGKTKTKALTPLHFIPVHKNTYFEIKSVAKSLV